MIEVLHILFGGGVGGLESRSIDLVEELQGRIGSQGVLLLSPRSGPVVERLDNIPGVSLFTHPYAGKIDLTRAVKTVCDREQVGAVLIYMFGLHVWAAAGARRAGVKKIFTCVGNPAPASGVALAKNALLAQVGRLFEDGEVACSQYVRATMLARYRLPGGRVPTIPNWCRTELIHQRAGSVREEAGTIGMVARLDRIKDHTTLIKAFARVLTVSPEAKLVLAGEGNERARLETLADELGASRSVEFLGTTLDVPALLGRLQVFAFSTTPDEGFGIALAEALAAGSPIVASNVGPVSEVIGDAGILVPPGDDEAMFQALADLLADASLRDSYREKALERSKAFDVSRAAEAFIQLLRSETMS